MAGMVICNMLVWTNFVKAMHAKDGPIVATVVSAATNYCLSVSVHFALQIAGSNGSNGYVRIRIFIRP